MTVGSNMGRATPLLGHEGPFHEVMGVNPIYDARAFLFGGGEIGPHTLLRFYILHCIFFPLVASLFMAVHFWRIRRDGFSGPLGVSADDGRTVFRTTAQVSCAFSLCRS